MAGRIAMLVLTGLVGLLLVYLSRFWTFELWPREGLLGIEALHPRGNLVGRWLQGTPFRPFELLLWAIGVFLVLTWVQHLFSFFKRDSQD